MMGAESTPIVDRYAPFVKIQIFFLPIVDSSALSMIGKKEIVDKQENMLYYLQQDKLSYRRIKYRRNGC